MIGRQFGLFLSEADELELRKILAKQFEGIVFLRSTSEIAVPVVLQCSERRTDRRILISESSFLENVQLKYLGANGIGYLVDSSISNVVEFDRSELVDVRGKSVNKAGRMFLIPRYLSGDTFVQKDEEFLDFATKVFRFCKRNLKKVDIAGTTTYFGDAAYDEHLKGDREFTYI